MLCKKFRGERKFALCYFLANNLTPGEIVFFILSIVIFTLLPLCLRKLSFIKWVSGCNSRRLLDVKEHWSLSWHFISRYLIYYMAQDISFENVAITSWNQVVTNQSFTTGTMNFLQLRLPIFIIRHSHYILFHHRYYSLFLTFLPLPRLNTQTEKGLLRELLAPAMLKGLSTDFSEWYCITDFPTRVYRRSKHPKVRVSKIQFYTFSNGNALLSSFGSATTAEERSWPAYNLETRSARPL